MYSIYKLMYGIKVPNKLRDDLFKSELSNFIDNPLGDSISTVEGHLLHFYLPYSGDDYPTIHIGCEIISTDNCMFLDKEPVLTLTKKEKEATHNFISKSLEKMLEDIDEYLNINPGNIDKNTLNKFINLINRKEYTTYFAYSTS